MLASKCLKKLQYILIAFSLAKQDAVIQPEDDKSGSPVKGEPSETVNEGVKSEDIKSESVKSETIKSESVKSEGDDTEQSEDNKENVKTEVKTEGGNQGETSKCDCSYMSKFSENQGERFD